MQEKRKYAWIPDIPDQRDRLLSAVMPLPKMIPPAVDLRSLCSVVEDQGALGSCTANAIVGALEVLEVKAAHSPQDLSRPQTTTLLCGGRTWPGSRSSLMMCGFGLVDKGTRQCHTF